MTEIAVVGAGLMGHALALVFALGGHQVRLTDSNAETLERAPGLMATALATLAEAGEVDASWDRRREGGGGGDCRTPGRQACAL
jgi:3-hydroxybutyryl-CoA dehydrogenase